MQIDTETILNMTAQVALALVAIRTVLQAAVKGLATLAVRLCEIDRRDGRTDWKWVARLSTVADVLAGILEATDDVLDVLPIRGITGKGKRR